MEIIQKLNEIEVLLKNQHTFFKEFLTLNKASEYLDLSKSALYKMTSKKEIPFYNPGGKKIYFKKEELNNWITSARVDSSLEVELDVAVYLSRKIK